MRINQLTLSKIKAAKPRSAFKAAIRGYETESEARAAQKLQPHPYNWYVWQMNDGRWHISLMTNRGV